LKHSLLRQKFNDVEAAIFNCTKCKELTELRRKKICNCPISGFDFDHYLNSRVCSVAEAPGIYKGEKYIEKIEDFHEMYDDRIMNIARIGKLIMKIYSKADITWADVQHFNTICCSPPNYRQPQFDEIDNCLPHLLARIQLMQQVKVIVTFGKVAKVAIKRLKIDVPVVNSFHPSYIFSYMPVEDREPYINDIADKIKKIINE
jgi:uracil-DNA glycosylase family 4